MNDSKLCDHTPSKHSGDNFYISGSLLNNLNWSKDWRSVYIRLFVVLKFAPVQRRAEGVILWVQTAPIKGPRLSSVLQFAGKTVRNFVGFSARLVRFFAFKTTLPKKFY